MEQSVELDRRESAFAVGLRQHVDVVVRVARRLAPAADAEDVAQEAMLAAWRYQHSFDPGRGPLRAWLLAIVVRESRKAHARSFRRTQLLSRLVLRDRVTERPVPDLQDPLAAAVEQGIAGLSRRQREVVNLYYYVDLPIEEISDVLGISTGTVKSTLADARTRIRHHVEGANR